MSISSIQYAQVPSPISRKIKIGIQARIVLVPIGVKSPLASHACLIGANFSTQRCGMPTLGLSLVSQSVRVIINSSLRELLRTWQAILYVTWVKTHVPVRATIFSSTLVDQGKGDRRSAPSYKSLAPQINSVMNTHLGGGGEEGDSEARWT